MKGLEYLNIVTQGNYNLSLNQIFRLPLECLIDTYSTGMKKKLAFWGVFELNKDVVILDEPFNGIDIESVEYFYKLIFEMRNQGKIVIISSHIIETLTRVCDRIGFLNEGRTSKVYDREHYYQLQKAIKELVNINIKDL